jgi:cytochrome P450
MMREVATELLAPAIAQGSLDMVEIAELYAAQIFCRLVGLPAERVHTIRGFAGIMHRAMDENIVEIIGELDAATEGVNAYAVEMLKRHKIHGGADLITSLLNATYEDDKLSEDELLNLTTVLLTASFGTVATEILWGIDLFTERPDILDRLYDEPESIPRFVTELLRARGSAASMTRVARTDVDIDGVTVPAGTVLILSMRAACRDPKAYADPTTFDMDRDDDSPLLTFGWGSHYCLGMHIGRAEVETFFAEFVQLVGEVRMAGELDASAALGLHAIRKLPVELIPRAGDASTAI